MGSGLVSDAQRVRGPYAQEGTDFSARLDLTGLPGGQDIFYRVVWEDLAGGALSEPMAGHFRTAPTAARNVRFLWSGDTAGQGFGINNDFGGMKIYEAMRALNPDFFIHCGDTIYADGPLQAEIKASDGSVWRNHVLTEEKSKVAEAGSFAARTATNSSMQRVAPQQVMQVWQWDDKSPTIGQPAKTHRQPLHRAWRC